METSTVWSRVKNVFEPPERKRLLSEVRLFETSSPELLRLKQAAEAEGLHGDLDAGWKTIHQAERHAVVDLSDQRLLSARVSLEAEVQSKLTGWRRLACINLLDLKTREGLVEAMRLMMTIGMLLLLGLGGYVVITWQVPGLSLDRLDLANVVGAMVLGSIAACLSALMTFSSASVDQPIPQRMANVTITATRPLIGAASGLVGLLAVQAKLINLPASGVGWIVPFLFGFSERMVYGSLKLDAPPNPK
jgi:ABC-type multidrug transport system fused ATPase/permease subunit